MSGASDPRDDFPHEQGKGKGRAVDLYDSSSSHNYWPFCATCDRPRCNPVNCIQNNHYLPGMALTGSSDLLPQDFQDDLQLSGQTDPIADFSDESYLFPTLDTAVSSNTVGSWVGVDESYGDESALYRESMAAESLLDQPSTQEGNMPEQLLYSDTQDVDMMDDVPSHLTALQLETLNFWLQRCEREHRRPSETEVQSIANLEHLSEDAVLAWFNARQRPVSLDPATPTDPIVLAQVSEYATRRANNDLSCSNAQSRKAGSDRRYKCTVGCSFSTDDLDGWKRHLRNRYPQRFWHCVLCRGTGRKPFICHRPDKICHHFQKIHFTEHASKHERLRDQSEVQHEGRFPRHCPFQNECGGSCSEMFQSWDEFVQHCLNHLNERPRDGSRHFKFKRRQPEDDDDHAGGGPTSSSSSGNAKSGSSDPFLSAKFESASNTRYKTTPVPSRSRGACCDPSLTARPSSLVDVRTRKIVQCPQRDAKWLALDYSWASERCAQSRLSYQNGSLIRSDGILQHTDLPTPFKRAMALTREMGYDYLWIDILCETTEDAQERDAVFRQAALIIVIVGFKTSPDHIWHFTCDYKNLQTVLSWAHSRIWNHMFYSLRPLGQGAYGIVDEVRLRSTRQTFARKVCLSRRDGRPLQPGYLQEIEMLQKFDHPNIPKFVAAYVQRQSLNILMLPVAECDLRELLSRPHRWASKLAFLPRWFLSLAQAIEYMHSLSCRHKDIKPANILISGQDVLLSDFGTSHDFSTSDSGSSGPGLMTPKYCAPEVAQKQKRGRKADIFSLGCVFLEMMTIYLGQTLDGLSKHLGFKSTAHDVQAVYHQHVSGIHAWLKHLSSFKLLPYQERLIRITGLMLNETPSKRPTAAELRKTLSPDHIQYAIMEPSLMPVHNNTTKILRLGSAGTRSSRALDICFRSSSSTNLDLSATVHSVSIYNIKTIDLWQLLYRFKGSHCSWLSMLPIEDAGHFQYAAISYVWGSELYEEALTYCGEASSQTTKHGPQNSRVSTASAFVLVVGGSRRDKLATASGEGAATALSATSKMLLLMLRYTRRTSFAIKVVPTESACLSGLVLERTFPGALCASADSTTEHGALQRKSSDLYRNVSNIANPDSLACGKSTTQQSPDGRSMWTDPVLMAVNAMVDGSTISSKGADNTDESRPESEDPKHRRWHLIDLRRRLQASSSLWKSSLRPTGQGQLWRILKMKWMKLDNTLSRYEQKMMLALLSQKSKMAHIVKRKLKHLVPPSEAGCGACPQHGQGYVTHGRVDKSLVDPEACWEDEHSVTQPRISFDVTPRGLLALNLPCRASPYLADGTIKSRQSETAASAMLGQRRSCHGHENRFDSPLLTDLAHSATSAAGDSRADSTKLAVMNHPILESMYSRSNRTTHHISNVRTLDSPYSSLDGYATTASRTTQDVSLQQYCTEVGGVGFVPIGATLDTLQKHGGSKHRHCTCDHDTPSFESCLPSQDRSDTCSELDSDTHNICSSSQMVNSIRSASSCTSLASLVHTDSEWSAAALSDTLRLDTAEVDNAGVSFLNERSLGGIDLRQKTHNGGDPCEG